MSVPVDFVLSPQERQWLAALRQGEAAARIQHSQRSSASYCSNPFNLLRWAYAYEGDLSLAAQKLARHLRIREILDLDNVECLDEQDGIDEAADDYAPLNILGTIADDDHRILLLEQSGRFDLQTMMKSIRTSAFMLNRFRCMERVMRHIDAQERRTGWQSSAVMVIDLEGLSFHSNLLGFISGPYRILWGTLIEQYPFLISQIVIVNSPASMSVLWSACSAFIPTEYRKKIHLAGSDWRAEISKLLPLHTLPAEYGGSRAFSIRPPSACVPQTPKALLSFNEMLLEEVIVPAGGFVVHTFELQEHEKMEFFMKHDQEFTMNIFYHEQRRQITKPNEDTQDMEEAFAGCERPGLPTLDHWQWTVPKSGFYHAIYGNEKAWIMAITFKYQLFRTHENGLKIRVNPLETQSI